MTWMDGCMDVCRMHTYLLVNNVYIVLQYEWRGGRRTKYAVPRTVRWHLMDIVCRRRLRSGVFEWICMGLHIAVYFGFRAK